MQKIKLKQTVVIALAGVMMMQASLTGCGEKKVDYNIDGSSEGNNGESGKNTSNRDGIGGKLNIPESCDETLATGNTGLGKITLKDDSIDVPKTDKMDVLHITQKKPDNDYKKKLAEQIFEKDKGIYVYDDAHPTKKDLQEDIDSYKKYMEASQGNGEDVSYMEDLIKEAEAKMADALEEYEAAGDYSADTFIGTRDGIDYMLSAGMYDQNAGMAEVAFLPKKGNAFLELRPHEGAEYVYLTEENYRRDETTDESGGNSGDMKPEDAEDYAVKFLADLGITEFSEPEIRDMYWNYGDDTGEHDAVETGGYVVEFKKSVGGTGQVYSGQIWNVDNIQVSDGWIDIPGEYCKVYVYDGKILEFDMVQLMGEVSDKEENVELLSYDQMIEKANTEIPKYYEKYPTNYKNVEFNDVRLTYYLVSDGEGKFKYIPVWVFSQYQEMQESDGSNEPQQLVIMNAMDGTIIDIIEEAKAMGFYQSYDEIDDKMVTEIVD